MEEEITNLNIVDEEEEPVQALGNEDVIEEDYSLCLVGLVLMDSMVHFPLMRNILVDLWQPLGGVSIMEIGEKQVLFRFFNEGEDLLQVTLIYAIFWVQVHNLPMSFMSEGMARQFGNFIGQFLKLGYREGFCPVRLTEGSQEVVFGWDTSLRAPPRKATPVASRWLRDDSMDGIRIEMELDGGQEERTFGDIQFVHPYQIRESRVGGHQDMSRNHTVLVKLKCCQSQSFNG
ncbi:hypothetical protein PVK06_045298 [Gossypium arboreum]|uniref:DUF4283 domain-containing protein n=1 Tax=Gossypium arboreum TaxID=29729 RepID=A0ABR0MTP3_GOSAR|nr:hypothetical protein PVK06_045298 [Gossypium arboreum]